MQLGHATSRWRHSVSKCRPIKNVLHPVCTEDEHIALANDHSSLNDPTTTLKESIWVQKLHSAITAIF